MPKTKTKKTGLLDAILRRAEVDLTKLELSRQIDLVIEADHLKLETNPKGFASSHRAYGNYTLWACTWNVGGKPGLQMRCYESCDTAADFAQAVRVSSIRNAFAEYRCHHVVERRVKYAAGAGLVTSWKVHANPAMPF